MSQSYFPADRAGRTNWYDNFANEFPKVGKDLGFSDAEIANAVNDAKYAVHILTALGPDIDADPGHAGNAVLSGQSSGDFVDLPDGGSAPTPVARPSRLTNAPSQRFLRRSDSASAGNGRGDRENWLRPV